LTAAWEHSMIACCLRDKPKAAWRDPDEAVADKQRCGGLILCVCDTAAARHILSYGT